MQKLNRFSTTTVLALALACQCGALDAATFTYHGNLQDSGKPAEGNYDLELTLYSAPSGGRAIAGPLTLYKVPVHESGFSIEVDFGPLVNSPGESWLGVKVRNAGAAEFSALSVRSPVSPSALTSVCPGAWTLGGNAGNPAGSYLGTADNAPLELRANNSRVLRLESKFDANFGFTSNVIGGMSLNTVGTAVGATVGGGGSTLNGAGTACSTCGNSATGKFSVVAGGQSNASTGDYATVGGGQTNTASGPWSTVGGGTANLSNDSSATVAGGYANFAGDDASTVGGGNFNKAGSFATVPGGDSNCAGGYRSFAAGHHANVRGPAGSPLCAGVDADGDEGTFAWADNQGSYFVSTGPNQFLIRAAGNVGINTNAPRAPLHVQYGTTSLSTIPDPGTVLLAEKDSGNSFITIFGAAGVQRGLIFGEPGAIADGGIFYDNAGSNAMEFRTGGNTTRMTLASNGDLSITSDVATKPTAGGWTAASDARIKHDIRPVEHALDTLLRVRPVTFQYNDDYRAAHPGIGAQRYYNVVAQEFAEVFPEAVHSSGKLLPGAVPTPENEILQVDIHPALITTIAAVQEIAVAEQTRDERIAALSAENAELRARLDRVERLLAQRLHED